METLTGYSVEELFDSIEKKLNAVKSLWESKKKLNKELIELNFLLLDLSEALDVDIEKELNRANEVAKYIHTRIIEDMENGVFD